MPDVTDWNRLSTALSELHLALMERARRDYERANGAMSAAAFLQVLITDPSFEWLRHLSELMADIDLARDADLETRAELAATIRPVVEHLLGTAKGTGHPGHFAERYWKYVDEEPHVTLAHGGVRQALAAWPKEAADSGGALHERHRLAEKVRHRRPR